MMTIWLKEEGESISYKSRYERQVMTIGDLPLKATSTSQPKITFSYKYSTRFIPQIYDVMVIKIDLSVLDVKHILIDP